MQTPFSGKRGILSALPAPGMGSGKLGESRLSGGNHPAAVFDDSILAVLFSRLSYAVMNLIQNGDEPRIVTKFHERRL